MQKIVPKIAYVERTLSFNRVMDSLEPSSNDEVILLIRVENVPIEDVMNESKPYLEAENKKFYSLEREASAKRTLFKDGEPVFEIEPWTVMFFSIPQNISEFELQIMNCEKVSVVADHEILAELSELDIN